MVESWRQELIAGRSWSQKLIQETNKVIHYIVIKRSILKGKYNDYKHIYTPNPCLFNLYAEYIMRNAELEEAQAGIKITERNINNLQMTPPLWHKVKRN